MEPPWDRPSQLRTWKGPAVRCLSTSFFHLRGASADKEGPLGLTCWGTESNIPAWPWDTMKLCLLMVWGFGESGRETHAWRGPALISGTATHGGRGSGFESWHDHLPEMWCRVFYWTTLCLSFYSCKMGMMTASISPGTGVLPPVHTCITQLLSLGKRPCTPRPCAGWGWPWPLAFRLSMYFRPSLWAYSQDMSLDMFLGVLGVRIWMPGP